MGLENVVICSDGIQHPTKSHHSSMPFLNCAFGWNRKCWGGHLSVLDPHASCPFAATATWTSRRAIAIVDWWIKVFAVNLLLWDERFAATASSYFAVVKSWHQLHASHYREGSRQFNMFVFCLYFLYNFFRIEAEPQNTARERYKCMQLR